MLINVNFLIENTICCAGCCLSHVKHVYHSVISKHVLAPGMGHATRSHTTLKKFAKLVFINMISGMYIK